MNVYSLMKLFLNTFIRILKSITVCQALSSVQEHSLHCMYGEDGFGQMIMSVMCVKKMKEYCALGAWSRGLREGLLKEGNFLAEA